jgi:hypothetical protein
MERENGILVQLTIEQATDLSDSISDILCWIRGFRAGNKDSTNDPFGDETIRTFNLKLKSELESTKRVKC